MYGKTRDLHSGLTQTCVVYTKKLVGQMLRVSVHAQIATLKVNLTFKGTLV